MGSCDSLTAITTGSETFAGERFQCLLRTGILRHRSNEGPEFLFLLRDAVKQIDSTNQKLLTTFGDSTDPRREPISRPRWRHPGEYSAFGKVLTGNTVFSPESR